MAQPLVQATGRRKESVACATSLRRLRPFVLNGRALENYFPTMAQRIRVMEPLQVAQVIGRFDIQATLEGGGPPVRRMPSDSGSPASVDYDPELRPVLKRSGFLTRDARRAERKKYGLRKARRRRSTPSARHPPVPSDDFGGSSRLFGTDGIRGVANTELTADLALALGRAAAEVLDRARSSSAVIRGDRATCSRRRSRRVCTRRASTRLTSTCSPRVGSPISPPLPVHKRRGRLGFA